MTIVLHPKGKLSNPILLNNSNHQIHKKVHSQTPQPNSNPAKEIRAKQTIHNQFSNSKLNMISAGRTVASPTSPAHTMSQTIMSQHPNNIVSSLEDLNKSQPNQKNITSVTAKMGRRIWSLGKFGTFVLLLLISVSSPASCVPLRDGDLEVQELNSIPQQEFSGERLQPPMSSSSFSADHESEGESRRNVNYVVQPQRQLFLPSLFKSSPAAELRGDAWPQQRFGRQQELEEVSRNPTTSPRSQMHHLQKLQQTSPTEEDESSGFSKEEWETVIDPHLYLLTEWNSNPAPQPQQQRMRRNSGGPSLSIVNPLDVLRQRLLLEIARRKMRQSQNQIMLNADLLQKIGRR